MSTRPFIPFASDEEIAAIGRGVLDLSLPKPRWTHAAHFAAALWLISRRQDLDASRAMPGIIRAYNEATGVANTDTDGYHETITQASLRAARSFLLQEPGRSLFETCNALLASPLGRSDWLLGYWTPERLFSVKARRGWLEPDLKPLPWA
jgi:endonuclease III